MRLTRIPRECHRHSAFSMPRRGDRLAQSGYASGASGDAGDGAVADPTSQMRDPFGKLSAGCGAPALAVGPSKTRLCGGS